MRKAWLRFKCALFLMLPISVACSSPWMTGPLLAPNGRTIAPNHFDFEAYSFYTTAQQTRSFEEAPVLFVGLTEYMDMVMVTPYEINWSNGQSGSGFSDSLFGIGIQALRQKDDTWIPDLRIVVSEIFPTGKYDRLNPRKKETDQTGQGSYQTTVAFIFQRLTEFNNQHYLRTRLSLLAAKTQDVHVVGFNSYLSSTQAHGNIKIGNWYTVDAAFEYSLTQNWVPVFELQYINKQKSVFSFDHGFTADNFIGAAGGIEGGGVLTLAPALEYNFNEHWGVIAGVWFSVSGPTSKQFVANTIAVNYYF